MEIIERLWGLFQAHWPFVAIAVVLSVVGEVLKRTVWRKERTKHHRFFHYGRKTMAAHPVIAGGIIGALPGVPLPPDISTNIGASMYYAMAGVASIWLYSVAQDWAAERGVDLHIPGLTNPPPGPPPLPKTPPDTPDPVAKLD